MDYLGRSVLFTLRSAVLFKTNYYYYCCIYPDAKKTHAHVNMSKEKANNGQKSLASPPPKKSVFEPKSLIEKGLLISDQFCFITVVSIYLDMIGLFLG